MAKSKVPGYVAPAAETADSKPIALYAAIGVLIAVGVGAIIFAGIQSDSSNVGVIEKSEAITIAGEHLPAYPESEDPIPTNDPARGMVVPTVTGQNFDDEEVTFEGDRAEIRLFLAHWCSHCQAEVPLIVDWMSDGTIPEDIAVRAITTGTDESQPNYPPSGWLNTEEFTGDTLADDGGQSAAKAFALPGYPYFVAIDKDGKVVARGSGELQQAQIEQLVAMIQNGADSDTVVEAPDGSDVEPGTDVDLDLES